MTANGQTPQSSNVVWDGACVDRAQRWAAVGQGGATVWMTGLPASGKSTLAKALEAYLLASGKLAYRLDGDNMRHGLCGDLGFSPPDRDENIRRTAHVARLMADAGAISVVALVSPYRASRENARRLHDEEGIPFFEVFVDTPLEQCMARDPKGLYAKAKRGEMTGMTGVDDAYEPAVAPEVHLQPPWTTESAIQEIMMTLSTTARVLPPASPTR